MSEVASIDVVISDMQSQMYDKSKLDELLYAAIMKLKGYEIKFATKKQDQEEHWDVEIEKPTGEKYKVEVKGYKDSLRIHNYVLLELRNVIGGTGWLYGLSDGLAHRAAEDFIYFRTEGLRDLVKEKIKNWNSVKQDVINLDLVNSFKIDNPFFHEYEINSRNYLTYNGRKRLDLFVYVPFRDVKPLIIHRVK